MLDKKLNIKYRKKPVVVEAYQTDKEIIIHTLEGDMKANVGDYIITGVQGEQYPCKPDIFEQTYEMAIPDKSTDNKIKKGENKIKTFTNWLKNNSKDCGLLSPPLNPQLALEFLKNYLLGEDWYVVDPLRTEQVNTNIVFEILYKHSRKFRKEWKQYKKRGEQNAR